jgi:hypothetical protein
MLVEGNADWRVTFELHHHISLLIDSQRYVLLCDLLRLLVELHNRHTLDLLQKLTLLQYEISLMNSHFMRFSLQQGL